VRGESSEYVLVRLADGGISQMELLFEDDLIARPHLMTGSQSHRTESQDAVSTKKVNEAEIMVEFKDTKSFERLKPDSKRFKAYLRQLLYYLVIAEYDPGILCIHYANNQRMVWIKRDSGGDYFFSPKATDQDGKGTLAEIESWTVILEKGSPIRNILKKEIRNRVSLLKSALDANSDVQLPKVAEEWKCIKCPFKQTCNPSSVTKQDSEIDFLDENELIVTIESN
jgi:CRISPR/Cas system-associated exonuclease Cas4 (RecB family)